MCASPDKADGKMTFLSGRPAMIPGFLFPESTVHESGSGEPVEIGAGNGTVLLSLGITEILEQQSLDVEVQGSVDGEEWLDEPLRAFPQKFYKGVWQILCDLDAAPDVRFVKVRYKLARWGVGEPTPTFKFYVFADRLDG